jgi:hypothetical protein
MFRSLMCSLFLTSMAYGGQEVVWQIGKPDHDYSEFACARDYHAMAGRFTKPIVFEVGRSEAGREWPFIQPGPVDSWSPIRGQPWTIRFQLPQGPKGVYVLRIEFADVHKLDTPRYTVAIGERTGQFRLEPGAGDESLANPKVGKPQKIELSLPAEFFKKGPNEVRLTCTDGSWVQYDALTLLNDPDGKLPEPEIQSLSVASTPYFIRSGGKVCRAVDVGAATNTPAAALSLRVEAGGQVVELPARQNLQFGGIAQEVAVPDVNEPIEVKVTATVGKSTKTASAKILPQRKWRIYVAPSSHTDVGYTDLQPACAERHNQNTDTAVKLLRDFPDFRWNLEVSWQAENYFATRKGPLLEEFVKAAQEGKIGVQALYCNILTGLCSHEEACRLMAYAAKLHREKKILYRSAMISDVPTQEASLPMLLANAGIRYFSSGINNDRAYTMGQMQNKCPCWWEGPDGSRVLMMYMHGYAHASGWGLDQSVETARSAILNNLRSYEGRKDYPYDAVFLHGAVSDNCPLNARLAEVCKAWNERYEYPKVILCHNADFFEYIEKQYGDKLPVFRGSAGTYWEDGAGSSARETAMVRNAHEQVANGEKFLALADRIAGRAPHQSDAIYKAWRNCLLYDEHTWGAHCSISQPESDFTKAQWKIKSQFAVDAAQGAGGTMAYGAHALASLVRTLGKAIVWFNPSGWERDHIYFSYPNDCPSGSDPWSNRQVTVVRNIPPCGYQVLDLGGLEPIAALPGEGNVIESKHYRVEVDSATGGVKSIRDKQLDKELIDPKGGYGANQYVYVAGGNGSRIVANPGGPLPKLTITTSGPAKLRRLRYPGVGEAMIVETSGTMAPNISSMVAVWEDIKRVDFENRLDKTLTYDKEGVYFAFPFAAEKPTFRYEVPAGIVNANKDMLPGACLDWFTVQHFVEVEGQDAAIAWATPDSPLVCFQDVNKGKWQSKLDFATGHLFAYVMNNYWHTNYLAGQGGKHTFRFSLTSRAKSDRTASARFGWDAANPVQGAAVVAANANVKLLAKAASLLSLAEPNAMIIGVRHSETGPGFVVRLWEVAGKATTLHLKVHPLLRPTKATACNLVEVPGQALEIQDGTVAVPIRASGLATVLIE